jgi:hypothetical protein
MDEFTITVPEGADTEFRSCEMTFRLKPVLGTPFSTLEPVEGSIRYLDGRDGDSRP